MWTIAKTTIKEALRKKLLQLTVFLTIIYLILLYIFFYFVMKDIKSIQLNSMIINQTYSMISIIGFYFSSMIIAFFTIMSSIGAISSDIENGTAYAIIPRPIRRSEFILGKYFGLSILSIIYSVIIYFSIILISINLGLPSITILSIDKILLGVLFFIMQPIAILSLSILGSTKFKTLINGIFVISIYIVGSIGGLIEQIGSFVSNEKLINIGIISSLIAPFDVIYRKMLSSIFSSITSSNPLFATTSTSSSEPSDVMIIYIVFYIIVLPLLAIKIFSKKDI